MDLTRETRLGLKLRAEAQRRSPSTGRGMGDRGGGSSLQGKVPEEAALQGRLPEQPGLQCHRQGGEK